MTADRLKLLTGEYSLLIAVYQKISVIILKIFDNQLEYKFPLILFDKNFIEKEFKRYDWYAELLQQDDELLNFKNSCRYENQKYESKMELKWYPVSTYDL